MSDEIDSNYLSVEEFENKYGFNQIHHKVPFVYTNKYNPTVNDFSNIDYLLRYLLFHTNSAYIQNSVDTLHIYMNDECYLQELCQTHSTDFNNSNITVSYLENMLNGPIDQMSDEQILEKKNEIFGNLPFSLIGYKRDITDKITFPFVLFALKDFEPLPLNDEEFINAIYKQLTNVRFPHVFSHLFAVYCLSHIRYSSNMVYLPYNSKMTLNSFSESFGVCFRPTSYSSFLLFNKRFLQKFIYHLSYINFTNDNSLTSAKGTFSFKDGFFKQMYSTLMPYYMKDLFYSSSNSINNFLNYKQYFKESMEEIETQFHYYKNFYEEYSNNRLIPIDSTWKF